MASTSSPELPQVPAEISQDCERLLVSSALLQNSGILKVALGNARSLEESIKDLDAIVVGEPTHQPQLKNLLDSIDTLNEPWKPTSTIIGEEPPVEVSVTT
jgi:hypothetical protein